MGVIDKIYVKDIEIKKSPSSLYDIYLHIQTAEFNSTPMQFVDNFVDNYYSKVIIKELKEATTQEDLIRVKVLLDELEKTNGD